ncbi:PREDICTED: uncharacterized protein LOC104812214 [Tarenaya hassleriana]|uniref:uncharacterized protein LOC104812214 n=1 Tax=Tarenaya hassleriana TaxID=28532 RepID=UPI00053C6911|nr:PREDICTED: uncharacterized protein LOC104812214 [Tarenaya hassleriana]
MPLPWKKAKSGRISRFVADLQQSPKHGGSLVVETGFPTSLIDLFVKNRDRLKKPPSKRRQSSSAVDPPPSPPRRSSLPPPLTRRGSFPPPLPPPPPREEPAEREAVASSKVEERVSGDNTPVAGGGWDLMSVVKVFVVSVLALSTKKLTVGITLSALALLFLEFAAPRLFTRLKLCPSARIRLDSFVQMFLGKRGKAETVAIDGKKAISCEITETFEDSRDCTEGIRAPESCTNTVCWKEQESGVIPDKNSRDLSVEPSVDSKRANVPVEQEVQTIRDIVFKNERSRSSKLKSNIVKKMVPKKLRSSMKKKKSMKMKEKEEEVEVEEEKGGGEGSLTEVSSIVSDDKSERIGGEISERDDDDLNPQLWQSYREVEEESPDGSPKGHNKTNVLVLIVMMLVGLLGGKVLAIGLFLLWCQILRFSGKSKTRLMNV